jgi:hypothetical protein
VVPRSAYGRARPPVRAPGVRDERTTYRLVNMPANPSGRCGAPETEPGPSGWKMSS